MKIKICGLTNLEDVLLADKLGTDFLGFIFYNKSPRNNELDNALAVLENYQGTAKPVAVFVNELYEKIVDICIQTNIKIIQLHGVEDYILISKLKDKGFEVFKALSIKDESSFDYDMKLKPDRFLLDTFLVSKSIIAGGINIKTIDLLLKKIRPWGIDISSGVEVYPGKKDYHKMVELFNKIGEYKIC